VSVPVVMISPAASGSNCVWPASDLHEVVECDHRLPADVGSAALLHDRAVTREGGGERRERVEQWTAVVMHGTGAPTTSAPCNPNEAVPRPASNFQSA
jgi:hypothetical protein